MGIIFGSEALPAIGAVFTFSTLPFALNSGVGRPRRALAQKMGLENLDTMCDQLDDQIDGNQYSPMSSNQRIA